MMALELSSNCARRARASQVGWRHDVDGRVRAAACESDESAGHRSRSSGPAQVVDGDAAAGPQAGDPPGRPRGWQRGERTQFAGADCSSISVTRAGRPPAASTSKSTPRRRVGQGRAPDRRGPTSTHSRAVSASPGGRRPSRAGRFRTPSAAGRLRRGARRACGDGDRGPARSAGRMPVGPGPQRYRSKACRWPGGSRNSGRATRRGCRRRRPGTAAGCRPKRPTPRRGCVGRAVRRSGSRCGRRRG